MPRVASKGFSLIELMVVIAIVTIITVVVLVRQSAYDSSTLLTNLAYDVALSLREAQSYGISVHATGGGNPFGAAYGIHFNVNNPTTYLFFADLDGNNRLTDPSGPELIQTYQLNRGHKVKDVCITIGIGSANCFSTNTLTDADIVFRRPKPDAIINGNANASVKITLTDQGGVSERSVEVLTTGEISITNP